MAVGDLRACIVIERDRLAEASTSSPPSEEEGVPEWGSGHRSSIHCSRPLSEEETKRDQLAEASVSLPPSEEEGVPSEEGASEFCF